MNELSFFQLLPEQGGFFVLNRKQLLNPRLPLDYEERLKHESSRGFVITVSRKLISLEGSRS